MAIFKPSNKQLNMNPQTKLCATLRSVVFLSFLFNASLASLPKSFDYEIQLVQSVDRMEKGEIVNEFAE